VSDLAYRIGVVFPASADPVDLPAFAVRAEELGFDMLWVIEDCFLSGGLTMAATALAVTEAIGVGVGLLPAPVRNPAIAAMEIATLGRIHPGRFEVTLGHGVAEWMAQIGALPAGRLAALRETVTAIRGLLHGQKVTVDGTYIKLSEVSLEQPPRIAPPVLIGTTGPKGLALARRHADGILLPEGSGPAFVQWAVGQMSATTTARCVVYSWFSIEDDAAHARRRLLPAIDRWLELDLFPDARRAAGVTDPMPLDSSSRAALAEAVSVCGDAEMCADAVRRLVAAGADTVALAPPGDDLDGQLGRFASEVRPFLAVA
jgi:alkanesulfonate monooxygenase SsuD/methylene tetrahydromethanopterin reductase-like flavin-dependent oxidoreductase (luciferase family)